MLACRHPRGSRVPAASIAPGEGGGHRGDGAIHRGRTRPHRIAPVALVGLAQLVVVPELDVPWEHHPSHFWLVLAVALVNVGLGLATSEAARRRSDGRLFLVSLAL